MHFDELVWKRDANVHGHDVGTHPSPCDYVVRDGEIYVIMPSIPFPGADPDGERFWVYKAGRLYAYAAIDMADMCLWLVAASPPAEGATYINTFDDEIVCVQIRAGKLYRLWSRPSRPGPLTVKGVFPRG